MEKKDDIIDERFSVGGLDRFPNWEILKTVNLNLLKCEIKSNAFTDSLDNDEVELVSFFDLYLGEDRIGRAYVLHYSFEIGENAPVIEEIEILEKYQHQGYGSSFLTIIEDYFRDLCYRKIFAIQIMTQDAINFFNKNGYIIDFDLGEKTL